ncbi:pyridoxamine 5'-phosphate oxidase family protein [Paenibacillus sp. KR2-11]|nr:pyridoxamine 5'-phosphate oxidase family protein [Paenibacillus caseinilyticus]
MQERAGVAEIARKVGGGIRRTIPAPAKLFLEAQPLLLAGAAAGDGRVWASPLSGSPGFLSVPDERTMRVGALPLPQDPLGPVLLPGARAGFLAVEFATRRRMRLNGMVTQIDEAGFAVSAEQVYANCPKYIQLRTWVEEEEGRGGGPPKAKRPQAARELSAAQAAWLGSADTFFIASRHPGEGADVSHRGGAPGFVRVTNGRTILFPDYAGNAMFNTLGNLLVSPEAGLLFLDFERGDVLQLSGRASVEENGDSPADFPGAERVVRFELDEVRHTRGALPLKWKFGGYSPFLPGTL